MKRNVMIVVVLLVMVMSACAPEAAPTANPLDVQHTAEAAAFTMVAQTQEAVPTSTPVPPTETASPTIPATLTSIPSVTDEAGLATTTGVPTIATPQQSSSSTQDDCNKPLTEWDGPTANFTIFNETRPQGTIVLSLYATTPRGECGYLVDLSSGPVGAYSAGAFVDGERDFKVFGGFVVQEGNWKIIVRNDKIIAQGSCYPNC